MVGTAHLNPFKKYPKMTWAGLTLLAFAAGMFLASVFVSPTDTLAADILSRLSGLLAVIALWILLLIAVIIEQRQKYAALFLLGGGLFLLAATVAVLFQTGLPLLLISSQGTL